MVEYFNNGGLVWLPSNNRVYQLNQTAIFILQRTNGKLTQQEVARSLATLFNNHIIQVEKDVNELYLYWLCQGIVDLIKE